MSKQKKSPWTKAQRAKLTAILHPHPNDPPDFILSADEAWERTGFGEKPAQWSLEVGTALLKRALDEEKRSDFLAYTIAAHGIEEAIAAYELVFPARLMGYLDFRRYLYVVDDATFARARAKIMASWDDAEWNRKAERAFVLSRDPSVARKLFEEEPAPPRATAHLLIGVGDPQLAAQILQASKGDIYSLEEAFDLVETYGGAAAPMLEGFLTRYQGKGKYRKPIDQALKLAKAIAEFEGTDDASRGPIMAVHSGPTLPAEGIYDGLSVVVAGKFEIPGVSPAHQDEIVKRRLDARGLWAIDKTPKKSTKAYFEGEGAKPALREKAEKAKVPIFGAADLRSLIATPLLNYRERTLHKIERSLRSILEEVTAWYIGEPASEAQLKAAERAFGIPLDPALIALYSQCDGIQFRSSAVDTHDAEVQNLAPEKHGWGEVGNSIHRLGSGTSGAISILPIDDLIASRSFGMDPSDNHGFSITIGKRKVDLGDFLENLYILDHWYDYYPVGLHVDKERGVFEVVIGDDHGADWSDPYVESVETYLERLVQGHPLARDHGRPFSRPRE